jgi:hypothetical protein
LPGKGNFRLAQALRGGIERLAQEAEPLQRVEAAVSGAMAICPFVIARDEYRRHGKGVEVIPIFRIDVVFAAGIAFFYVANMDYKRLVLLQFGIDIGDHALVGRSGINLNSIRRRARCGTVWRIADHSKVETQVILVLRERRYGKDEQYARQSNHCHCFHFQGSELQFRDLQCAATKKI